MQNNQGGKGQYGHVYLEIKPLLEAKKLQI